MTDRQNSTVNGTVLADDIVTRLRHDEGPPWCWECVEYGCIDDNGDGVPCRHFGHDEWQCTNERKCKCECHRWEQAVTEAANEIERLRAQLEQSRQDHLATFLELMEERCG